MRPRRSLSVPLFVTLASLSPVSAFAAGRIAVLAPQLKPAGATELRDKFHDALAKGLEKAGDIVMPAVEVRTRLESTPELLSCDGGSCAKSAAALLGAEKVVLAEVEVVGKNYTIKTRFYDAIGNDLGAGPEERCEICTVREAGRAVERAGERAAPVVLAAKAPDPVPAAGKVSQTDDEAPGNKASTPVVVAAASTETKPETKPAATATETKPVPTTETTPGTTPETKPEGSRFPYRPLAYTAFGVAAASLAATIAFGVYAAHDGNYLNSDGSTCTAADPVHGCPRLYSGNTAGAAVFGVVTALSAGTGALLLYLDWKKRPRHTAFMAAPIPNGFAASASLEF